MFRNELREKECLILAETMTELCSKKAVNKYVDELCLVQRYFILTFPLPNGRTNSLTF
jgi:hypothetical protein